MNVRAIPNETCRYFCDSADGKHVYLVDLLENGGLARCSCTDWSTRRAQLVKQGIRAKCKHIAKCQEEFLYSITKRLSETT